MRAIFSPPRAMLRVFVLLLLLLQDVFCVRALARTMMVRVVLRVRSKKFGERESFYFFGGGVAALSPLPFFFGFSLFFSLLVFLLVLLFGGWRRTHTTPQTTPRREKIGEEEYCYRCGITHARPQSSRSLLLSLFQSVFV